MIDIFIPKKKKKTLMDSATVAENFGIYMNKVLNRTCPQECLHEIDSTVLILLSPFKRLSNLCVY